MNKEELIVLRNQLIEQIKSQRKYVNGLQKEENKQSLTLKEIEQKNTTQEALEFFEKNIEKHLRYLCTNAIDFNGIIIDCKVCCFISEDCYKKVSSDDDNYKYSLKPGPIKPNDILNDYVYINFMFMGCILDEDGNLYDDDIEHELDEKIEYNDENKLFIVKYNDFIEKIKELNYDIDVETFEEIKNMKLKADADEEVYPRIIIDLTNKRKKTL